MGEGSLFALFVQYNFHSSLPAPNRIWLGFSAFIYCIDQVTSQVHQLGSELTDFHSLLFYCEEVKCC